MSTGKVYLVGAGPGDVGLITVKGLECLRHADVIVYDHLLDERLLSEAPQRAERVYAGKSAGEHFLEQDEINRMLVQKAQEGKTVVRLKGGDPFVLGRGGEEAEALVRNGIPFEIVPGVTSAVAVPAYAGIPVTHRGLASSFAVVAGHEDPHKDVSSVHWQQLAQGVDTLVFLMGGQNLPKIVEKLVRHGRSPQTPVAVIKNGTRPEQETVAGTLENIVSRVGKRRLDAPAIIVVGEVVRLRQRLRWFDNRPLSGKRVMVTRARHQAGKLSQLLAERGATPVEFPSIEIQPAESEELDQALRQLETYDWLVFTSVNGVNAFFKRLAALKMDARALHNLKIITIGPATAKALTDRSLSPDFLPREYSTASIVSGLKDVSITGQRFLLPRADIADKELADGITHLGATVHEIPVYRNVAAKDSIPKAVELLRARKIDVIAFTSSSTVVNLASALGAHTRSLKGVTVACIGPKTADAARRAGLKVDIVATEYTMTGMVAAIEKYFAKEP